MHIAKLQLVNYRNFEHVSIPFKRGINTVIGENGAGKTNLFRAMRLLLDEQMIRFAFKLDESDFHRGPGGWQGHWIIISLEFDDVSPDEAIQALFLHGTGNVANGKIGRATYNLIFRPKDSVRAALAQLSDGDTSGLETLRKKISIDEYETIFTGKSTADFSDPAVYKRLVGDFKNVKFSKEPNPPEIGSKVPRILSVSKEISFTYIQALRDVVADFQSNRTNPLFALLRSKSGEINPEDFKPITRLVDDLNTSIECLPDVNGIRADIRETIKDTVGETYSPQSMSIRSELSAEADRLFQSLKLFVGESESDYEGGIHELSLGGANLIYLTLKLLEFKYQKAKQSFANILLVEEPEAHIHTHIQRTLFDKLNYSDTQIIYSTHSTQISEVSNIEAVSVLGRNGQKCEAYTPTRGLDPEQIGNIQRYLDAVRSNLLFAKSVILVEGDAEEILLPILTKKLLGVTVDELGISIINIRSTGFQNVASLFHDHRIRKRCCIVTDADASFFDINPDKSDSPELAAEKKKAQRSQESGITRKASLTGFCAGNSWIRLFLASHTFEVDFVSAGNCKSAVDALVSVYKDAPTKLSSKTDLESGDIGRFGRRILTMANHVGKGWFAVLLGKTISSDTIIPPYIVDALLFAHGALNRETLFKILKYRLRCIADGRKSATTAIESFGKELDEYREGSRKFGDLRDSMSKAFPADGIHAILAKI